MKVKVSRDRVITTKPGYRATVPGTVLSSFINIGAIPDPNFADNQLHIGLIFYFGFLHRNEFIVNNLLIMFS